MTFHSSFCKRLTSKGVKKRKKNRSNLKTRFASERRPIKTKSRIGLTRRTLNINNWRNEKARSDRGRAGRAGALPICPGQLPAPKSAPAVKKRNCGVVTVWGPGVMAVRSPRRTGSQAFNRRIRNSKTLRGNSQ